MKIEKQQNVYNITVDVTEMLALKNVITDIVKKSIIEEYKGEETPTFTSIAKKYGCTSVNISNLLMRNGVILEKRITVKNKSKK